MVLRAWNPNTEKLRHKNHKVKASQDYVVRRWHKNKKINKTNEINHENTVPSGLSSYNDNLVIFKQKGLPLELDHVDLLTSDCQLKELGEISFCFI